MFFLQMSGFPGSGKSTLAKRIAKEVGAVIVDHDVVKSALLTATENELERSVAGKISYSIDWALVDYYLSQGLNVILDSPSLYSEMVDKGVNLTEKYQASYKYIECYLNDIKEINKRLSERKRMVSQIEQAASEETFNKTIQNSKKPEHIECLTVNTAEPIEQYLGRVMQYLKD